MLRGASHVRPPAVAGLFYAADQVELSETVAGLLTEAESPTEAPVALIAPHAGFRYSGPVAASAFACLRSTAWNRVVVIGPSHFHAFRGIALSGFVAFDSPLGVVPVDTEAEALLLSREAVSVVPEAHDREHCVEVELPFLQTLLGDFRLLALVVGEASAGEVAATLEPVWDDETLLVVSSDLTHFLDYETARRRDHATALAIEGLNRDDFDPEEACGAAAINGLVRVARQRGLLARTLDLRSSGDTSGSRDSVVGYGAWSFTRRL